jgi:hypothetical protein
MNEILKLEMCNIEYTLQEFEDNLIIEAMEISSTTKSQDLQINNNLIKHWKTVLTPNNFREKLANLKNTTQWEQIKMLLKLFFKDDSKMIIHCNSLTDEITLESNDEQINFFFGKIKLKLFSMEEKKIENNNEQRVLSILQEKLLNLELYTQDLNKKIETQFLRFEEIITQNQEKIRILEETVENQSKTIRDLTEISIKKENIFKDYIHLEETVFKLTNKIVNLNFFFYFQNFFFFISKIFFLIYKF